MSRHISLLLELDEDSVGDVDLVLSGKRLSLSRVSPRSNCCHVREVWPQELLFEGPIVVVTSPDPLCESGDIVDVLALNECHSFVMLKSCLPQVIAELADLDTQGPEPLRPKFVGLHRDVLMVPRVLGRLKERTPISISPRARRSWQGLQ